MISPPLIMKFPYDGTVEVPYKLVEKYIGWMAKHIDKQRKETKMPESESYTWSINQRYARPKYMELIVEFLQQCLSQKLPAIVRRAGNDGLWSNGESGAKVTNVEPWMMDFFSNCGSYDDIQWSIFLSYAYGIDIFSCYASLF